MGVALTANHRPSVHSNDVLDVLEVVIRQQAAIAELVKQRDYWIRQLDGDDVHMQFSIDEDNKSIHAILAGNKQ